MFEFNFNNETFYDVKTKIWSGGKFKDYYDRNCSIGRIVFEEMRRRPKHICQISDTEDSRLSNEEVLLQAIRIARFFKTCGITQTDIIGLEDRNTTYQMAVIIACLFHGSAYHAINPSYDEKTINNVFNITKPKIIFCDGWDYGKIQKATKDFMPKFVTMKHHIAGVPTVLGLLVPTKWEQTFEPAELENGADQTMAILCSSGSTGLPKAVTISHNKRIFDIFSYFTAEDILFVTSTPDWISATITLLASTIYGAQRIISDKPFAAEYFLDVVEKYKVTFTVVPPTFLVKLINSPAISGKKLESMRYLAYGGGRCTVQTQYKIQSFLKNGHLRFIYGFTEFGRIPTVNCNFQEKPNSVGRLLPGYKMKIINDNAESLGPGEIGEICCYHGENWNGYYDNVEATKALHDNLGWFHTGDLGYFDEDNYLFVVDRKKDMLKYQAMQYCPNEIEEVIAKMNNVLEVCVCGIWNELDGDAAAAAVVKKPESSLTEKDITEFVKNNIEAKYKHLHAGAIIVNELPKTPNGKISREGTKKLFQKN